MHPLALGAEDASNSAGRRPGVADPVRRARVELGDLAGLEDEVAGAEDEADPAAEDVEPLVALVGLQRRQRVCSTGMTILKDAARRGGGSGR